jgi:beta-lactamase superfamily II metal-dependent hydrolase
MPFEFEFLRVGNGASSGDAIVSRYWDGIAWRVMLIDGGYEETGDRICEHVEQWYATDTIDYVVSTHPDNDHISGLRSVLTHKRVRELWLHVPWLHAERLLPLFASRRWTKEGLASELRRAYPLVAELIELAGKQGTSIRGAFQGEQIGSFTVLSPSIAMYEGLLPQFRDTPAPDPDGLRRLGHWLQGIGRRSSALVRRNVPENWYRETLREGGVTAAENESCVVLYGNLGAGGILLTADAGLRALTEAANFADARGFPLKNGLWLFDVPHHGSRNNVSPSVLDRLLGPVVVEGQRRSTAAIISAGAEDETHPRQVVVNALTRRGVSPYVTRNGTVRFNHGIPRNGWGAVPPLAFSSIVEAYD